MAEKTKPEAALDELLQGKTTAEIVAPEGLLKQVCVFRPCESRFREILNHDSDVRE